MVCRGCCRVTRRYFCSDRLRLGNTAWAAWYGLSACLRLPEHQVDVIEHGFTIISDNAKCITYHPQGVPQVVEGELTCQNLFSHSPDVSEGLLGGGDQSGAPLPDFPLVLLDIVIAVVVAALGDIRHNR